MALNGHSRMSIGTLRSLVFTSTLCQENLYLTPRISARVILDGPASPKTIDPEYVVENQDTTHGMKRTEVRSTHGDSHLGHVFDDGPRAMGGMRYCINSASLRFIPLDELESEGSGQYNRLFESQHGAKCDGQLN